MKKIITFILVVVLVSCEKELITTEPTNELQTIKIESLKNLLPITESSTKTKAVFYNSAGNEIVFDFILEEKVEEKIIKSKSYFTEAIGISYESEDIDDYSLYVIGSGNYIEIGDPPVIGIIAGINQFVEPVNSMLTLNNSGSPILAMFYETRTLVDKEFDKVYSNFIVDEFSSFSEVYYNATYGIVGFKDRTDDLYVFKAFMD